uniref:Apoptosis facilitator Bcl-2-like protein 14 n=2 Tax=Nothobranchius korthausae TaxID=1143690 RepID=A0A1A8EY31_9TELE
MDNGHVKDHNLISDNNNQTTKPKPGSDMEDTEEFRLLRAYALRRRPKRTRPGAGVLNGVGANAAGPPADKIQTEKDESEKAKKKKTVGKRRSIFFQCFRPQTDEAEPPPPAAEDNNVRGRSIMRSSGDPPVLKLMGSSSVGEEEDEMQDVAARLVEITDEIEFVPSDLEVDSEEDEVERTVALMLRESGDQLNTRFQEANLSLELFSNYDFFRRVVEAFLDRIGFRSRDPEALGPRASPKTQIAVTCEVTSRLSTLDTLPTNHLLRHGARFLQDYYSSWAQQHGGYEAVFQSEDEELD